MSIVVSDASPLINLARVGHFDLLTTFYGRIVIPQVVYDEVVVRGQSRDGNREVKEASWIEIRVPQDELAVRALATELGRGEAAAIILAQELQAALLLIDEIRGRRIAQQLGLKVRGTIGILHVQNERDGSPTWDRCSTCCVREAPGLIRDCTKKCCGLWVNRRR